MYTVLIFLFVIVAILMTISILMQSSKGGGLAASFGGMGGGGVFGPRGAASFLQKATTILAVVYAVLCLVIGLIGRPTATRTSVIQQQMQKQRQVAESPLPVAPIEGSEQTPQQQPQPQQAPEEAPAEQPQK